jgi:hypothetical protein
MKGVTKSATWTSVFLGMLILMLAQLTPVQAKELRSSNSADMTASSAPGFDGYQNSTAEYSGEGYQFDEYGECTIVHFKPDYVCVKKSYDFYVDDYGFCTLTLIDVVREQDTDPSQCPEADTCAPHGCSASPD